MYKKVLLAALFLLFFSCISCTNEPQKGLLVYNAQVFDGTQKLAKLHAIYIEEDKIVEVGPSLQMKQKYQQIVGRELDIKGAFLMPSIIDGHSHPIGGAKGLEQIQLSGLKSLEAIQQTVQAYIDAHPNAKAYYGRGWELSLFKDGNPSKELLDALLADKPIILVSWDGHSSWVNSKALEAAEVTAATQDPENGRIERLTNGEPTGTLRESAMSLMAPLYPEESVEEYARLLRVAIERAHSLGITGIFEAATSEKMLQAMQLLAENDALNMRFVTHLDLGFSPAKAIKDIDELAKQYSSIPLVKSRAVKIFADGTPESHTAALLEPYEDRHDDHGILNFAPERLNQIVDSLDALGFQIHIHALGDAAIKYSLDALEDSNPALRHHICHLQIMDPSDVERFAAYDVTANLQAFWAQGDDLNLKVIEPIVGEERSRAMYPFGDLKRAGARLAAGSDWPVSTDNPYMAMQVGVTRQQIGVKNDVVYKEDQRLDIEDLLTAYTKTNAWLMHLEGQVGEIKEGMSADFIVLDRDLTEVAADSIASSQVLYTFFKGAEVYRKKEGA
jgi:predicted amidohydrolase YtcJ